ncbi:MAG: DUF3667 domain-containing protein [Bacteroidia bacterium]
MPSETLNKNCLNCNSELPENAKYCSNCGQKVDSPIIRFKDFVKDAFEDYFSIDSKIFKSLLPLLFKPGFLTLEYIKGKRNSYIPPFKMFLIISVLYFLLISLMEEKDDFIKIEENHAESVTLNEDSSAKNNKERDVSIKFDGLSDSKLAEVLAHIKDSSELIYINKHGLKAYIDSVFTGESFFYKFWSRKILTMHLSDGKNFGELMFNSIQKLVFIMAPIMALILILLYYRKKIFFMQHLIFAFHYHAFVFLILIIEDAFLFWTPQIVSSIFFLICLVYLAIAIKKVYQQSWGKSIFKFIFLFIGYIILGIPLLAGLSVASAILMY